MKPVAANAPAVSAPAIATQLLQSFFITDVDLRRVVSQFL
jgi:hypothetical protein